MEPMEENIYPAPTEPDLGNVRICRREKVYFELSGLAFNDDQAD